MDENDDFGMELIIPEDDDPGFQLRKTCANLFNKNHFVDVTISCPDGQVQAHRMILSSASTYLYNLFVSTPWPTPCSHPVIILRKSTAADVRSSLEFIYAGKTRTSKNKLLALMDVARELGFTTLLKAIETGIQSCGIEMFRRLSSSSAKDTPRLASVSLSEPKHNSNKITVPNEITIKEEKFGHDDVRDGPHKLSESNSKNKRHIPQNSLSNGSKKIRLSNADSNYSNSLQINGSSWMEKQTVHGNSSKSNGQNNVESFSNSNSNLIQLQHDKGESFVYTSEDFSMMGGNEGEDEEDQIESGDEHDMLIPQQSMTIPNGISVLTIPSIRKANGSGNSLKVEIKQEEQDDSVPASCPWCLQVFTSLTLLQRHIKTHVGNNKPFTCEYCQNTFARSAHLKRHLRTHTGEKPYQCSICQRPFARQDKLKVHLERHLQNPAKNENNSMTITSYPPPALSQSSGGQVPIKILIPAGQSSSRKSVIPIPTPSPESDNMNINSNPLSPQLQRAGTSVTLTSTSLHSSPYSEKGGSVINIKGSPSPPTITPISNVILNQKRIGKSMNFNFLVN